MIAQEPSFQQMTTEELLQLLDADVQIITLVTGRLQDGTDHYAYALIPPSRYVAFKKAEQAGAYNLADYGKIIAHGAGQQPPLDVQRQVEKQYGASHTFEEELATMVGAMSQSLPPSADH